MLDDFILNDSYDAWEDEFEEMMDAWEDYCEECAKEADGLQN